MRRSTIGLNLLWLVPDDVGGSEQSTVATLRGLVDLDPPDLALRLFVLPAFAEAHPDIVSALPTEIARCTGRSRLRRVLAESSWLARRTRSLALVHHLGGTVPARRTAPCVLTLHDLRPLIAGEPNAGLKGAYLARAVPRSVRAARRVVVPSSYVRNTVIERLGAPPSKIAVIPHAIPLRPQATPPSTLVQRYRLTGPVVLYAAVTYHHKNHQTLLDAFARVRVKHADAILVLPGGVDGAEGALRRRIVGDPGGLASAVRRLGRISEADLAGLLELAEVVAVPSRYEGFGLPVLEAMAAGVPVVAADATSLPEVTGGAGILVAPDDVVGWAAAIERLLSDADERARLAKVGLARAARFTSSANAAAHADLYRQALADG